MSPWGNFTLCYRETALHFHNTAKVICELCDDHVELFLSFFLQNSHNSKVFSDKLFEIFLKGPGKLLAVSLHKSDSCSCLPGKESDLMLSMFLMLSSHHGYKEWLFEFLK